MTPRPLSVLLVEDSDDDAQLVLRELRRGGWAPSFARVDTEAELVRSLREGHWQLVLSDYSMPRFTGLAALEVVKDLAPDLPFILVSGTAGEDTAVMAMRCGAADYLLKGNLQRLNAAVERELEAATRRHARRRSDEALAASEAALAAANARFRHLFEVLPDIVTVVRGGRFVFVNPAFERATGFSAAQMLGREVLSLVHPDDRAATTSASGAAGEVPARQVHRWLHRDGGAITVELRTEIIDFDGHRALLAVARDVSERVRAEEALRSSEERFRTLVHSLDDLVFTLDLQQRFTEVYGPWVQEFGLQREQCLGKTVGEVLGGDAHPAAAQRALAGERTVYDWAYALPDGVHHFQTSLTPLFDARGKTTGLVGVGRDATHMKRAEEQLLVADRMVSMGALAAGVAHEINNPLAAVLANLEFLRQDLAQAQRAATPGAEVAALTAALAEPLADAREAAERVRQIARDLKVFSRAADQEHTSAVDVEAVLDSTTRLAWNEIRHRARLTRDYGAVPRVHGNESRLGQVFLNLLVNAAQAIPDGHFDAHEIHLATRVTPQGLVEVEVRDSGAGIPLEVQPRLFTPFVTTKPVGVGTGLGLSICQRIVTELGGTIRFESTPGKGTTFFVALPTTSQPAAAAPAAEPVLRAVRRAQVLVIDDEPLIASSLRRALSDEHDITLASSGVRALELYRQGHRFDVLFCDLMMPEMTGIELFRALESEAPEQAARVIFLTGGAFTPGANDFIDSVTNTRLEKPFEISQLKRAVANALR